MLNEDFFDAKDLKILKLKSVIDHFKKYDEERKAFIQKLQWELEDVSQQYQDLKACLADNGQYAAMQEKIQKLKTTVHGQNKTITNLKRQLSFIQDEKLLQRAERIVGRYGVVELKNANDKLQKELSRLREDNKALLMHILKLERQTAVSQ